MINKSPVIVCNKTKVNLDKLAWRDSNNNGSVDKGELFIRGTNKQIPQKQLSCIIDVRNKLFLSHNPMQSSIRIDNGTDTLLNKYPITKSHVMSLLRTLKPSMEGEIIFSIEINEGTQLKTLRYTISSTDKAGNILFIEKQLSNFEEKYIFQSLPKSITREIRSYMKSNEAKQ